MSEHVIKNSIDTNEFSLTAQQTATAGKLADQIYYSNSATEKHEILSVYFSSAADVVVDQLSLIWAIASQTEDTGRKFNFNWNVVFESSVPQTATVALDAGKNYVVEGYGAGGGGHFYSKNS